MALFGPLSSGGNKHLVEMKAGRMKIENNKVQAIKEKGLLYVEYGTDSMLHLYWQNRETKSVMQDLLIMPGEAQFKKIEQCTTGKVYVLYFSNTKLKHLYWIQEPREEKEKELVEKLNQYLTSGASQNEGRGGGEMSELISNLRNSDLPGMFGNMDPSTIEQLLQLQGGLAGGDGSGESLRQLIGGLTDQNSSLGGAMSGRTGTSSSQSQTRAQAAAASSLLGQRGNTDASRTIPPRSAQNLFSGNASRQTHLGALVHQLQLPPGAMAAARQLETPQSHKPLISDVITVESMTDLLQDEEAVQSLYGLLQNSPEPIENALTSPQFLEAVNIFSQGFASCQLGPLMNEFGPDAVQAAKTGDFLALAKAIEATLNETTAATEDVDLIDPNDELD